ncbi:MAG: hypothetical protein AB1340_01700 [Pseudomonadota bacterium]
MPYARRDAAGHIIALLREPADDALELLPPDDPQVQAFLHERRVDSEAYLNRSDQELARVMEDLIEVLVDKHVILFTDLPPAAQHKLASRRSARARLAGEGPLWGASDDDIL